MPTATSSKPYDWLKSISPSLAALERIPAISSPAEFSWDQLNAMLRKQFEIDSLTVETGISRWLPQAELIEGLPQPLDPLYFSVGSLSGTACWLISKSDVGLLMSTMLTKETQPLTLEDPQFLEGFYHFIALEIIHTLEQLGFSGTITPRLSQQGDLPQDSESYCVDLTLSIHDRSIKGRLVLSRDLVAGWKEYLAKKAREPRMLQASLQQVPVTVHLEAGKVSLHSTDWKRAKKGDFILLDSCTITPGAEKGRLLLTIEGIPIFRAMLKTDKIKILEYPLYHEVDTLMSNPPNDQPEDDEDELSEIEDDEDDDESEHEEEIGEEEVDQDVEEQHTPLPIEPNRREVMEPVAITDLPLNVVIEVGRINMTFSKLAELQPGSLLELDVSPEDGVDLVVNGRCIGRGELLRVGESLGVRILEKG